MAMTPQEKLELYRNIIAQLTHEAGGHLVIGPPPDEMGGKTGTLLNRPTEDGGVEFRYTIDGEPS